MSYLRQTPLSEPVPFTLPKLPLYDSECNLFDVWTEEADPNFEGVATAYFEHVDVEVDGYEPDGWTEWGKAAALVAVALDYGDITIIHSRSQAVEAMGWRAVERVEECQGEAV